MTSTAHDPAADQALRAKHRAMWTLGDYPAVATAVIADLGPTLVAAGGIGPGDRVLDVAAGSGWPPRPASRSSGPRATPRRCRTPTTPSTR